MKASTAVDLTAVLRRYPLDAPVVVGKHEAGIINDNWRVAASSGNEYLLRGYRRVLDPDRVMFQLLFQESLRQQGFPTAAVIRTSTGDAFAIVEGVPWALFANVEGKEFDFASLAQAAEAGRRLAQFQTVAAGYDGPVAPVVPGEVDFADMLAPVSSHMWRNSILAEEHDERLRQIFPGPQFEPELAFFRRWRRRATAVWPRERLAPLPQSWLHCDYHGRNMVFRGHGMVGLFDFDFVTRGPRVYDPARGIFNFGREKRGSTTLRDEFCRAFIEGYEGEAPLSHEEHEALPFMAVLNWAPEAGFYALRLVDEGEERIVRRLQHDVKMMRVVEAEMQRLAPAFGWKVV